MPKGGNRPGAGAPKGNLNAVKTGQYSKRLRALAKSLAEVPEVREFLLEYTRRQKRAQRKAERIAYEAVQDLILTGAPEVNNPLLAYARETDPNPVRPPFFLN